MTEQEKQLQEGLEAPAKKAADKTMIERACEVLTRMLVEVTYFDKDSITEHYNKYEFIEDFKKAMEE